MSAVKNMAADFASWLTKSRPPAYTKIYADEEAESVPSPGFRTRKSRWLLRLSPKALLALVAPVLLFSFVLIAVNREGPTTSRFSSKEDGLAPLPPIENGGPRRLRVIVPADAPSPNLCKMLMSALVSGYPSPVIVNWGRKFNKSPGWFGGSHLGKIDGTLEFLDIITSDRAPKDERLGEDDLVLVVDAYDLWFQLPPAVLVRRYLAQIYAAEERIHKEWGSDYRSWLSSSNTTDFFPRQSIIISTQKKCWPDPSLGFEPHCDELPESSAREDLYGPHTDEELEQFHDIRPRYVNSGSFMGPVGDMRRMLRRAQEKVNEKRAAGIDIFSDQGILAEMFGEQEIWRASKRQDRAIGKKVQAEDAEVTLEAERFDYSIGLDYIQDLFTPTVFEEDDGEYVVLNDGPALKAAAEDRVIIPQRVNGVPDDILGLRTPMAEAGVRVHLGWGDVPLYTDFWSTSVPVMVHHNAHRNGLKDQRLRDWWKKTWFFPDLRRLLELQARPKALEPLFKVSGENGVKDLVYWAPPSDSKKRKTRIFDKEKLKTEGLVEAEWDALCKAEDHDEWWNEIFDDRKGPIGSQKSNQ